MARVIRNIVGYSIRPMSLLATISQRTTRTFMALETSKILLMSFCDRCIESFRRRHENIRLHACAFPIGMRNCADGATGRKEQVKMIVDVLPSMMRIVSKAGLLAGSLIRNMDLRPPSQKFSRIAGISKPVAVATQCGHLGIRWFR